jgi:GTP-binding protein HflX
MAKTLISGRGKDMSQQQGGVGAGSGGAKASRGPGETEKEYLYRHYSELILKAERKLKLLTSTRHVQRKRRLKSGLPLVSLVGYTNAGKSSLLNTLTNAKVLAENKLFATLDTTTKELFLTHGKRALISDTVGFISELPHHLVKAFESTLDELRYADLLVHVVDVSNNSWGKQIQVVNKTLLDIGVQQRMVYVFNKIDLSTSEQLEKAKEYFSTSVDAEDAQFFFISTKKESGLSELKDFLINDESLWRNMGDKYSYQHDYVFDTESNSDDKDSSEK